MYVLYSLDFAATVFWAHCRKHTGEETETPFSKTVDTNCLNKRAAFIFIHFLYQNQSVKQNIFELFLFFGSRCVGKVVFFLFVPFRSICSEVIDADIRQNFLFHVCILTLFSLWSEQKIVWAPDSDRFCANTLEALHRHFCHLFFLFVLCCLSFSNVMLCYS